MQARLQSFRHNSFFISPLPTRQRPGIIQRIVQRRLVFFGENDDNDNDNDNISAGEQDRGRSRTRQWVMLGSDAEGSIEF